MIIEIIKLGIILIAWLGLVVFILLIPLLLGGLLLKALVDSLAEVLEEVEKRRRGAR